MENKITSYRDLIVWQKAMDLTVLIYTYTEAFPKNEVYGLKSQMRRCAVSIPSNIAEGKMRGSRKDFRQFLIIAYASGAELETQLEVSLRLRYGEKDVIGRINGLLSEVMKMLNKFIGSLSAKT
jgi:four helix bundle protein